MATQSWNAPLVHNNDSDFQAWASGISAALNALLTKTADTGQTSAAALAAASRPAASNAVAGYEIFRLNDAYQATYPIFIKVEYGEANTLTWPGLYVTVGTGTNGAGAVTGILQGRIIVGGGSTGAAGTMYESCAGAGDGYFWLAQGCVAVSNFNSWLMIERFRNADGTPKPGIYTSANYITTGNASSTFFTVAPPAATPQGMVTMPIMHPENGEFVSVGGDVPLLPTEPFYGRRQPPSLCMVGLRHADVGDGAVIQTTLLGAARLFRKITTSNSVNQLNFGRKGATNATMALAMRWE